jgi:hypothetical protein
MPMILICFLTSGATATLRFRVPERGAAAAIVKRFRLVIRRFPVPGPPTLPQRAFSPLAVHLTNNHHHNCDLKCDPYGPAWTLLIP